MSHTGYHSLYNSPDNQSQQYNVSPEYEMHVQHAVPVYPLRNLEGNIHNDSSRSPYGTENDAFLHQDSSEFLTAAPISGKPGLQNERIMLGQSRRIFTGWQKCVLLGCACSVLVLACNISLLVWAKTKPPGSVVNTFLLWYGDCDRSKTISTWVHLAINILSSIILCSSNYAMQILVAPTREILNAAHKNGRSLDIGIQSITNWKYVGKRRKLLYLFLLLTSIPLHLLYNSVIFTTTSTYDYTMALVSQDFLQVKPTYKGMSLLNGSSLVPYDADMIYSLWQDASRNHWTTLGTHDCYSTFGVDFVHNYKNVLLVTQINSSEYNTSFFEDLYHPSYDPGLSYGWFCGQSYGQCQPDINQINEWIIPLYYNFTSTGPTTHNVLQHVKVQYCLAQPGLPSCTVELMPGLLLAVIVCNILKILALLSLVFFKFDPIITIGDAIASFMASNDSTTDGWGAISARNLRAAESKRQRIYSQSGRQWQSTTHRYFSGATLARWVVTLILCLTYWLIGCALEGASSARNSLGNSMKRQWQNGFGAIVPELTARWWKMSIPGTVLVVNSPQLLLSFVYLFYNSLFTCMLLSAEWTSYAYQRKSLRVSCRTGEQRSTYFLSLPYRFSLPLLVASTLLHWLMSQSLFLAQVNIYDNMGQPRLYGGISSIGWSSLALMVLLIVGGLLILGLVLFGFRCYKPGIPLVLSDSRAISASCHTGDSSGYDQSLKKLQYGVIGDAGYGKYHVGFSSGFVRPLADGEAYI